MTESPSATAQRLLVQAADAVLGAAVALMGVPMEPTHVETGLRHVAFPYASDEGDRDDGQRTADRLLGGEGEAARAEGQRRADHWTSSPQRWSEHPEESLLSRETIAIVERAATSLPAAQRAVVILRDVVGCDAHEVCDMLGITATNQRVLLHRARTKVRTALEQHLGPRGQTP